MTRFALLITLLCTLSGCSVTSVIRVEDRRRISVDAMIEELRDSRLILAGERHDAPAHHALQLSILQGVQQRGKQVALGMEMFEGVSQAMLDAWVAGKIPEEAFAKLYRWNWRNLPWGLYRDLLIYARDQRIPVVALNAPRQVVQAVRQRGLASLSAEELALIPPGAGAPVSEEFIDFMSASYPMHSSNSRFLCEAQALRNRVMAARIRDYLGRHPDAVMVVVAGGGHVRGKGGIPAELSGWSYRVILPPVPGFTGREVTREDGDYMIEEPILDALF